MYHVICHVFFTFFIILGICDIFIFLISKFFKDNSPKKVYTFFVPVKGHAENIEFTIRSMMFRLRFIHPFLNFKVMIIDCGMDGETRFVCHNLCKIYQGSLIMVKNEDN
ncbi:MAG: hypothetical protein IJG00_05230 [Clostridia bacterium]|nr:hypothetical protein [Clostridia bacterium]